MRYIITLCLLVLLAGSAFAQTMDPIVSVYRDYTFHLTALGSSGMLYSNHGALTDGAAWVEIADIPEMAGRPATSDFVALTTRQRPSTVYPNPLVNCALTAAGEVYIANGIGEWSFDVVIGDAAGRPPVGRFIGIAPTSDLEAITDLGELYRRDGGISAPVSWEYVNTIADEIGAVTAKKETLGSVKSLFR